MEVNMEIEKIILDTNDIMKQHLQDELVKMHQNSTQRIF